MTPLAVIMINYKTLDMTLDAITSLEPDHEAMPGMRVVVVDNDSQDGSADAIDAAIAFGERARRAWIRAASSRDDWPAARRNVERVARKLARLKAQRRAAQARAKKARGGPRPDRQAPPPEAARPGQPKPKTVELPPAGELRPAQVRRLLDKLAETERKKRTLRRARQRAISPEGRDW